MKTKHKEPANWYEITIATLALTAVVVFLSVAKIKGWI